MFNVECSSGKKFQRVRRVNLDENFMCNLDHVPSMVKCLPNLKFISLVHNRLNKAQKGELKGELKRLKVLAQVFDFNEIEIVRRECHDDDDECLAEKVFFKK